MRTKTKPKVNASTPRLSDEDIDPLEQDDVAETIGQQIVEHWTFREQTDIEDIRNIIDKLPVKSRYILEAFLDGKTYHDVGVTEKYWRYHFGKGVERIKKELNV